MTGNPLSGHTNHNMPALSGTATSVDGLADGDHILSPSLTNLYEGTHGNGILLLEDTATGASNRNVPEDLPGVCEQITNAYTVRVVGGHCVLDGVVYDFAGGVGSHEDLDLISTSAHKRGSPSALTSGQEALVVVYVSTDDGTGVAHLYWEMGTAVTTGTNVYPTCPSSFLNEPNASLSVKQSVVLAVLRVVYQSNASNLDVQITESNDKRVFIRPTPMYLTPVTTGAVGATTAVNSHTALDNIHGGGVQTGNFAGSTLGGVWQSFDGDGNSVLYYSAKQGGSRHTWRMMPNRVTTSTATSLTVKFDDSNILVLTPGGACTVAVSGTFPPGHVVEIKNKSGSNTVTFAGLTAIATNGYGRFVYTGSAWERLL